MWTRPLGQPDRISRRTRRAWRPEAPAPLEVRALLAASPIIPTFNGGQPIITPISESTTTASRPSAVAVQGDGKVVVVGTNSPGTANGVVPPTPIALNVARYNPDGTLDPTFGTGGRVTVELPTDADSVAYDQAATARDVLIQPDGSIVVAVSLIDEQTFGMFGTFDRPVASVVARLTSTGALDASFGTSGLTEIATNTPSFSQLALQADGAIVLAGSATVPFGSNPSTQATTVTRLTAAGAVDSAFNSGAPVVLGPNSGGVLTDAGVLDLSIDAGGQIRVVSRLLGTEPTFSESRLTAAGALDSTFGTGGTITASVGTTGSIQGGQLTPSGQIYIALAPGNETDATLSRFNANGTPDPTFVAPRAITASSLAIGADGSIVLANAFSAFTFQKLRPDGTPDQNFGPGGIARILVPDAIALTGTGSFFGTRSFTDIATPALLADGRVVVAGRKGYLSRGVGSIAPTVDLGSQAVVGILGATNRLLGLNGDHDGDNRSDIAAVLTSLPAYAYRQSTGGDVVEPFGIPGAGQTVAAPGDYDGDGRADVAAFLPELGILAYRPSSGGTDQYVRFGPTGLGTAIPVPGDYDGDGRTDVALFLPGPATFVIKPSGGGVPYAVDFGAGQRQSIPVPGDFDGSGRTQVAVYIPSLGRFFYRSASSAQDVAIDFGPAGVGASIPLVSDYTGDGKDDLALYLPSTGTFAINPFSGSSATVAYAVAFGAAGPGQSVPIAGDFDGDGRADLAVYLPSIITFADRPSGGGADVLQAFGTGTATTVPASAPPGVTPVASVMAQAVAASDPAAGLVFFLPDATPSRRKPTA